MRIAAMSGHSQPETNVPVVNLDPDQTPTSTLPDTARDGSPALRPGDADSMPATDGEPIFSTDPLAGRP